MLDRLAVIVVALALVGPTHAQGKFNKKLTLGQAAPTWTNLPGVDGKKHSLADLKNDIVVLVVTCNHCPIAVRYEDRIIDFVKKNPKVAVVALNVNLRDIDRLPKMEERAKKKGFTFPYLFDESQAVARAYGATVTPEFFVLNKDRKVAYMGAMDDNNDADSATTHYLQSVVDALQEGKALPVRETKGRGCLVEYEK